MGNITEKFKNILLFLSSVYGCQPVCMKAQHVHDRKWTQIPARAALALNPWVIFPAPYKTFFKKQQQKMPTSHQICMFSDLSLAVFLCFKHFRLYPNLKGLGGVNILFNGYFFSIHISCQPAPTKSKALSQNVLREMLWVRWGGWEPDFSSNENCWGLILSLVSFIPSLRTKILHEA